MKSTMEKIRDDLHNLATQDPSEKEQALEHTIKVLFTQRDQLLGACESAQEDLDPTSLAHHKVTKAIKSIKEVSIH